MQKRRKAAFARSKRNFQNSATRARIPIRTSTVPPKISATLITSNFSLHGAHIMFEKTRKQILYHT
jgi:hypothetical protein